MFYNRDVLSIIDFSVDDLKKLFEVSLEMEKYSRSKLSILDGKVLSLAFFEPSTRTRLSFETAMKRLGGQVIGFHEPAEAAIAKGENLADTIRMLDNYSDVIVIRHKLEGAAKLAAEVASAPVINGGDGSQHHPTQAMIDLYTIWRELGKLEGLSVGVIGDLKYGRAATSFIYAISKYKPKKLFLISPPLLKARVEVKDYLRHVNVTYEEVENLADVISELDVAYMTRIQKERFPDISEYEKVKGSYRIDVSMLSNAKEDLIILHPLPKVDEIDLKVDETKYAKYFKQAAYGIPVRMALLALILGAVS